MYNFQLYDEEKNLVGVISINEDAYRKILITRANKQHLLFSDEGRDLKYVLIRMESIGGINRVAERSDPEAL